MERLISYQEGKQLNKYFGLFKGNACEYSEVNKVAKQAIEVLIYDGSIVAQKHLFDKDETLVPHPRIIHRDLPDLGEFGPNGEIL